MSRLFLVAILLMLFILNEAASPLFLQAITSALATIPFTGGPMSTGLVGAKLGIGTKLLYYLGFFGRRSKKPAPKAPKKTPSSVRGAPKNLQPLPLPYMFGGGANPMSGFQSSRVPASGGVDPSQLLQALIAQGVDPNVAMSALNYAGGMGSNANFPPFGMNQGFGGNTGFNPGMNQGFGGGFNPAMSPGFGGGNAGMNPSFMSNSIPAQGFLPPNGAGAGAPFSKEPEVPEISPEDEGPSDDVESFFNFLQDMDDNTCISRLICDIGADPSFLGEFSENINSMVGSLTVPTSSQAYPYMEILQNGRAGGQCQEKFPECTDASYEVVKSVAPSVDLPTGKV